MALSYIVCLALVYLLGVAAQPPSCGNPTSLCLGVSDCDPCAIAEVSSTTQGVTLPRLTTTQRLAIASPAVGLLVFDTTAQLTYEYFSTGWAPMGTKVEPSVNLQEFTSNGTWTKPANALIVMVWAIGGGAGGDGYSGTQTSCGGQPGCTQLINQTGGSGGPPGSVSYRWFLASDLPSTVAVGIGLGGVGGVGGRAEDAVWIGGAGTAGGTTNFGSYVIAAGGQVSPYGYDNPNPGVYTTSTSTYEGLLSLTSLTSGGTSGVFTIPSGTYYTAAIDAQNATFLAPTGGGAGASAMYTVIADSGGLFSYWWNMSNTPSRAGCITPLAGGATTLAGSYVNPAPYLPYATVSKCACPGTWTNATCGSYIPYGPYPIAGIDNSQSDFSQTFYAGTGGQGGYADCSGTPGSPSPTNAIFCANGTLGAPGGKYGGGGGGGAAPGYAENYEITCPGSRGGGGPGAQGYLRVTTLVTQ